MSNTVVTSPGVIFVMTTVKLAATAGAARSQGTFVADLDHVKCDLSSRPLHRPNTRLRPMTAISNAELKQLAATHQPPQEWFEGESDKPF